MKGHLAFVAILISMLLSPKSGLAAQTYTRQLTLPLVLSLTGAEEARWQTELVLVNAGYLPVKLQFRYRSVAGSGTGSVDDTLEPFEQRVVPDAIAYLRSLGLDLPGTEHSGTLTATFRGVSDPNLAFLSARITTASGAGRAGLAMPAFAAGWDGPVWLPGLREDLDTRSNLALFHFGNPGEDSLVLRVTMIPSAPDSNPATSRVFEEHLAPGEFRQLDRVLSRAGLKSAFVRIERISGTSQFIAYASVTDRGTNDGSLVLPQPEGWTMLPEAVESPAWRTELVLTNPGHERIAIHLQWLVAAGKIPFDVSVEPMAETVISDLGAFLRSNVGVTLPETTRGSVTSRGEPVHPYLISARVLSRGTNGRYGVHLGGASPHGGTWDNTRIFGLSQDDSRRSSLILTNWDAFGSGQPVELRVAVWDGDRGRLASERTIQVEANRSVAFPSVLASEAPGVRNGWIEVTRLSGDNRFLAFSVLNDGAWPGAGTGDGQVILGQTHHVPIAPSSNRTLLSWTGGALPDGAMDCVYSCDPPSGMWMDRTDESWLVRAAGTDRHLSALPNPSPSPRRGHVFFGGAYDLEVLQHGSGPSNLDGVYSGLTEEGFTIELEVEDGDLVHGKYAWRGAPPTTGCPDHVDVDVALPPGFPVEPGWPFSAYGAGFLSGEMKEDGSLAGSLSLYLCHWGRIPLFRGGKFTATRKGDAMES